MQATSPHPDYAASTIVERIFRRAQINLSLFNTQNVGFGSPADIISETLFQVYKSGIPGSSCFIRLGQGAINASHAPSISSGSPLDQIFNVKLAVTEKKSNVIFNITEEEDEVVVDTL